MPSSTKPKESTLLGGPSSKAEFLLLMLDGVPDFPLNRDLREDIAAFPGEEPKNAAHWVELLKAETGAATWRDMNTHQKAKK